MHKFFVLVFCLCVFVKAAHSAVALLPPQEKPAEFAGEDGCYVPELNAVIAPNVPYSPPANVVGCKQYNCNNAGWTEIFTCGTVGAGPGCQVVAGNQTASYPDCCPGVLCTST